MKSFYIIKYINKIIYIIINKFLCDENIFNDNKN